MKHNLLFYWFLTLSALGATVAEPQPGCTNETENLYAACKTLSATPLDPAGLQALLDYSRSTSSIPNLKSQAMAAYTLAALAKGDTKLFLLAQKSHAASFPNDRSLVPVRLESCFVPCPACKGGSQSDKVCAVCRGQRSLFRLPAKVVTDYRTLLDKIQQSIQDETAIRMQIRRAKSEPVLEVRLRLLAQVLEKIRNRPEAGEIEHLLLTDQQTFKNQQAEKAAKAAQREQELTTLRGLKTSDNPKAAVITLRDYLAANPDSPDRIEVQTLLNECLGKLEKQRKREKQIYWFGGILIVLFGLSCIHINYFKYTVLPSKATAAKEPLKAGTDSPFTDPLTLAAQESKARAKTKTSRSIPSVDDQPPDGP